MRTLLLGMLALSLSAAVPTIEEKTKGMERRDGFTPFYWDAAQGKVWLELSKFGPEFLYVNSLPAGIGSNDIGLDRGQLGRTRVVRWERSGPKILLVQSNYDYRASSTNPDERRAVRDSFAESVLWGFEAAAESNGKVLVDATAFYTRDAHNVVDILQRARQGTYRLEPSRSAVYLPNTKNFPRNTEVEAIVTVTGGPAGRFLSSVTPSPDSVSVRMRNSFIALPEPGFTPREFDPRAGYFDGTYFDYSAPIGEPVEKRFIRRHRLQKKDPSAAVSDPVAPIVYYLDRGTPEPVRTALLDGARWWNQAFEAAGYRNAFRVELMPEGADPMDIRYNVIQWVHRSTRGWSYGASVTDPRTGEIIKGHVTLGSLRVRQDYLIATAFRAPFAAGENDPQMLEMSLSRMRQLSAHEVGHTLGLGHNYIASAENDASVMDYPHPYIALDAKGVPDLSKAYPSGIGAWDRVSINWGYREFPNGTNEKQALNEILDDAHKRGLQFLTDQDARPAGSAQPQTHLWDNGADSAAELTRFMTVRAAALSRFGENNIRIGDPSALLEDVLVPLYFGHRYQLEAAAKVVGGVNYKYTLRGDGQTPQVPVPGADQRKALDAVLATLKPEASVIPGSIVKLIPPRPAGYDPTRELFRKRTGSVFDPVAAADSLAGIVTALLLDSDRATRLVQNHAADTTQPGLDEVIDKLLATTWKAPRKPGLAAEVQRAIDLAALRQLMSLSADEDASGQARAVARAKVVALKTWAEANAPAADAAQKAHLSFAASEIAQWEKDPTKARLPKAIEPPPGMPIGMNGLMDCGQ